MAFLKIDPGQEVTVEVIDPTPEVGENRWGKAEYKYEVRHNGKQVTLSASEKLHEDIQSEVGPLTPGMRFSIHREGKGTDTRWSVATQRGGGETPAPQRSAPQSYSQPARTGGRDYAAIRDEYLAVLRDVYDHLARAQGPATGFSDEFINRNTQAVAATIYIRCDREGIPITVGRPEAPVTEERVPRQDTPRRADPSVEERLHKARIWLHELMGRAGAHPTEHDALLMYLARFDAEGNPPTFDGLSLDEFTGIAEITDNGKDLTVLKTAIENMRSGEGDDEGPTETPF